jgi:lysophospholipase L1-like esterase
MRILIVALAIATSTTALAQQSLTFSCAAKPVRHAWGLSANTRFSEAFPTDQPQFGFDLSAAPTAFSGDACSSDKPFFFSTAATDGDYKVTVTLGGPAASTTTLRAESRRLLLLEQAIPAGKSQTFTFIVNVRLPAIAGKNEDVKLKPREIGALDWDNKLTLEFNGEHPALRSITVTPVTNVPTVYIAGDSTVVDQDKEPWAAWGQMLPYFFTDRIAISNQAESGETIKSFVGERRFDKIDSTIKPGDYLLLQFAHNDQKSGPGNVPADTEYKDLIHRYIEMARAHGATTILVTSMNRRTFDSDGHITNSLAGYPEAMRQAAVAEHVGLIDLNAISKTLYETMGPDGTLKAFVHYPANTWPGQAAELKDDTHFNPYGAYELARAIVQSIRTQNLPLAPYLRKDIPAFDPAHPDSLATWHWPPSPAIDTATPYGR